MTAILMSYSISSAAQEYIAPKVEVSDQKVRKDGKVYYSHVVAERQTMFSISKAYNVTQDEIYDANPGLRENGLKKNSIIMIPVQSAVKETPVKKAVETQKAEVRKNDVIQQEMTQEVKVQTDEAPVQKAHTVRWYETLKDIAAKYKVSEEAIIAINNLPDRKVKNRQKLIIPTQEYAMSLAQSHAEEEGKQENDDYESMDLEIAFDIDEEEDTVNVITQRKIKATLLLPLKATGNTASKSNMDFYSGVLLAARELGESGINIDLNVYDVANGAFGTTRHELESSDIIIGPVAASDISRLYSTAPRLKALISPLDPKAEELTEIYSSMIHAPASRKIQYQDVAQWIKEDIMPGDRVIVISEKEARKGDEGKQICAAIDSAYLAYTPFSYSILEGRKIQEPLEAKMTAEGVNRVVIASDSEAFVNDVIRNLNLTIHNKFNVILYAPAKIRTFETIEIENFHNTNLHTSLTYYIDYNDEAVKTFIRKYRTLFKTEPTQFAFQGYDVARYFMGLCAKYGEDWMNNAEKASMLQSTFELKPSGNGGQTNVGIRRIVYSKEYSIEVYK